MPLWVRKISAWLTPRRIRAHAALLAICLWAVCAIDFSAPGLYDLAGNIKFQDFLPTYISARLIRENNFADLYNEPARAQRMRAIVAPKVNAPDGHLYALRLPNLYGPQVGLIFTPLAQLSFTDAALLWAAASLAVYFACIYFVWKYSPALHPHAALVLRCALAFPPVFHCFVRGQNSALALAFFTAAFLAFLADRKLLAGIALGFLIFKPQFLVAIPLVLLFSASWSTLAGLVLSSAAQLAFTRLSFGPAVMHAYFDMLRHLTSGAAELSLAPIQMHSLRSFWTLLLPSPGEAQVALALYGITSLAAITLTARLWKSSAPLTLRFSGLVLAAVLANPHLFVYDLLVLAPALLLIIVWTVTHSHHPSASWLRVLTYLAFLLPLVGPLSQWTHLQLSVLVFALLLWTIYVHRNSASDAEAPLSC